MTSRREVLGFGAAALTATAAGTLFAQQAQASTPTSGIFFNVKDYGATGNGTTSDTAAIQSAINAAAGAGSTGDGGVVWFPAGKYLIDAPGLAITKAVVLQGAGWGIPASGSTALTGSWLRVTTGGFNPIKVTTSAARGTIIRDLAVDHVQPAAGAGWAPNDAYSDTIWITADASAVTVEHLFLRQPTRGIKVTDAAQFTIRDIWGQPYKYGIYVDGCADVSRIEDIHFWPYASNDLAAGSVREWMRSNGEAIISRRNDNGHMSNLFAIGYKTGIHFGQGQLSGYDGSSHKIHLSNADFDTAGTGILIDGDGFTGQFTNLSVQDQFRFRGLGGVGIRVGGDGCTLTCANVQLIGSAQNGVRVTGSHNKLAFTNLQIANWDYGNAAFPAIEIDASAGDNSITLAGGGVQDDITPGSSTAAGTGAFITPWTTYIDNGTTFTHSSSPAFYKAAGSNHIYGYVRANLT